MRTVLFAAFPPLVQDFEQFYSLQTNNLGQELLTFLILPTILKTEKENPEGPKPRIVVVSSGAARNTSLDDDLINHPHMLKRMSEASYCSPESVFLFQLPDTADSKSDNTLQGHEP